MVEPAAGVWTSERPAFHFTPREGWLNDPLAITHDGVRYHLFYQRVPDSLDWQPNCHWGHATSVDLIDWNASLPDALVPDAIDDGCWSGSLAVTDDGPQLFYSSVKTDDYNISQVCRATAHDRAWLSWAKQGPVDLPLEHGTRVFRDPYVFHDGDWRMLVGGSDVDESAVVYEYSSEDLVDWTFKGRRLSLPRDTDAVPWTGSACECPSSITVDGTEVLVFSVWDRDCLFHVVGCLPHDDGTFSVDGLQQLSFGNSYYAATTFRDEFGQPCVLFWLRGFGGKQDRPWTGALSVVQRIQVVDRQIQLAPHPYLSRLASSAVTTQVESASVHVLPSRCRMFVNPDPASGERALKLFSNDTELLKIHSTSAGVVIATTDGQWCVPEEQAQDEWVVLRDGAILEVFLGAAVFACRVPREAGISVQFTGGRVQDLARSGTGEGLNTP